MSTTDSPAKDKSTIKLPHLNEGTPTQTPIIICERLVVSNNSVLENNSPLSK